MTAFAVLGASGFVGRVLVHRLAADGHDVVAVARRPVPVPAGVQTRLVESDWNAAVSGADVVVHLIARTHRLHETGAPDEVLARYRSTNVELTGDVLRACEAQGVRRLVYLSSVKAMGESRPQPYSERDTCRPVDAYGQTKREAELLLPAADLETVVLRPPLVYGPGVGGNVARLLAAVRRGLPLPLGRATARRSLIGVDNLADAVETAALHPAAAGETFLVADREVLSVRELVEALAAGAGVRPRMLPVPVSLLRAAGAAVRRGDEVARLVRPLVLDTTHVRERLGWTPPVPATDGLRRVAAGE